MTRRLFSALLAVALVASAYMPYSHGSGEIVRAAPAHHACAGHDTRPDTSHVSDCLSKILLKNTLEQDSPTLPAQIRSEYVASLSPYSFFLPPEAVGRLTRIHSPPSFFGLSAGPAPFVAVTVLRI